MNYALRAHALFVLVLFSGTLAAEGPTLLGEWIAPSEDVDTVRDTSGNGRDLALRGAKVLHRQEDLVDHPHIYLDGEGAHAVVNASSGLNPTHITISLWFRTGDLPIESQVPLLVKSLPQHTEPWYQYGLFLMDTREHPHAVAFYGSAGGRLVLAEASSVDWGSNWNHLAATYDGATARVYVNGSEATHAAVDPALLDAYDTPILLGAYANLPKAIGNCFNGAIAEARLYDGALDAQAVLAEYERTRGAFPDRRESAVEESEYARSLNAALREGRDVWGETIIAEGGATYDRVKDYLRPLFYSTGFTNETLGVHNLLWGLDGGEPPYIIPVADGSRITADRYDNTNDLTVFVGADATEPYGHDVQRLAHPVLEGGYYPILQAAYEDAQGIRYTQESFASPLDGVEGLAAFVRITAHPADGAKTTLRFVRGGESGLAASGVLLHEGREDRWEADSDSATCTLIWHPTRPLTFDAETVNRLYDEKQSEWRAYWDALLVKGAQFNVPEKLVMDVQQNLLIQNLIMRWRYSLGAVVYHDSFYQPESSDAVATLGLYGFPDAHRDGLEYLVNQTKGAQYYANWERAEKLTHAAHYYHLTCDKAFIERNTPAYEAFCEEFRRQIEADPNGLLQKERQCGDIPQVSYFVWHQTLGWRGMRDMAVIWKEIGRDDLYDRYYPVANGLQQAIAQAMKVSQKDMPDGTLFIPRMLLEDAPIEAPVTETRLGSYWNLCMPYAFASGFWDPHGGDMDRIVGFMRNHGSFLLGLLRFNYYPTPIGSYRAQGLPGYYTTGFDNVYLPDYLQLIANRDEAEQIILTFYGKLAHGQTRGTYVSGEGETVGERAGEFYRSCYGTPCSANNNAFLLPLRLMLVRESFDREKGLPESLYLAHATPREWLEDGKSIRVANAPTCFGPVSYRIDSHLAHNTIEASISLPNRNSAKNVYFKIRAPLGFTMIGVHVNGNPHAHFETTSEIIDLSGLEGRIDLAITYKAP
ncbi:MAG: LamG domain-containing protein [Candidatus Hydrogenedentes bacterium]|nr:LamG domain-containing protein [Candidatus Hydrogenedentota bacterium]